VGKYSWEVETIKRFFMALLNASLEDIKKSSVTHHFSSKQI